MANIFIIVEGQTEEQFYKRLVQNEFRNEDGSYRHYFQVVAMPSKRTFTGEAKKVGESALMSARTISGVFCGRLPTAT